MAKQLIFRIVAVFLLATGVFCVIFPFADLFLPGGPRLVLDTHAYFKTGDGNSAARAERVNCLAETFGTRGRGGNGPMRLWKCEISYTTQAADKADNPAATNPESQALLFAPIRPLVTDSRQPLVRQLPFDRSGDLPELRLMSAAGDEDVYGVVWGGNELSIRWLMWALLALLFLGFGGGCLYAAKRGWQRGARA